MNYAGGDFKYRSDREMSIPDMIKKLDEYRELYKKSNRNILRGMATAGLDTSGLDPGSGLLEVDRVIQTLKDSSTSPSLSNEERRAVRKRLQELENTKRHVRSYRDMSRRYLQAESKYLVEIHKKIAMPFAAIIFVLIGAPLGMIVRRGGLGMSGGISLVFFLIYWGILMTGERLADRLLMSPWLAMWGANIIFTFIGLLLVHYAIRERLSIHIPLWVKNIFNKLKKR
ncbi:MAG: LptF/LptG family permease [Candidatus Marinimicrobia bacterium]|nr:LptF/LptG family permease [Candidatus Neomarinimicrobiota bacterium]